MAEMTLLYFLIHIGTSPAIQAFIASHDLLVGSTVLA